MELTTEFMQKYVGGQQEVVNDHEGYRYRCQIKAIQIVPEPDLAKGPHVPGHGQCATLHVEYDYCCKWSQDKPGYVPCENKPFDLSLYIAHANEISMNRLACRRASFIGRAAETAAACGCRVGTPTRQGLPCGGSRP